KRAHGVVRAALGPPLGWEVMRRRPVGRIGGIAGTADADALSALTSALGLGAQVLPLDGPLVCDWDCCWHGGARITGPQQWQTLVGEGRLGEVEGAFVLAWLRPDGSLTLARDALGERTLYYAACSAGVVFASTIRALLATDLVSRDLELASVATYLAY